MGLILLTASILAQIGAVIQASRLAWKKRQPGWVMLAIAVGLMLGRRVETIIVQYSNGRSIDPIAEFLALMISVSLTVGFSWLLSWPIAVPTELVAANEPVLQPMNRLKQQALLLGGLVLLSVAGLIYITYQADPKSLAWVLGFASILLVVLPLSLALLYQVSAVSQQAAVAAISKQRQSETAMHQGELAYRTLIETSHDLIWSMDAQGRWTFLNSAASKIFGYEPAEMLGLPFMKFQTPEQAKLDLEVFALIKSGAPSINHETSHLRKDGSTVWLNFNAVVLRNEQGGVMGATGTAQDITERIRTDAALKLEQSLFSSLLKTIPDHVYFKDRQSRFVRINDIMVQRFGLQHSAQALGKTDFDYFGEEHARQAYTDEQQVMSTGEAIIGLEEKENWSDGRITWVSTTKVAVRDADGNVTGLVGISRDITERKQTEFARDHSLALIMATLESTADGILVVNSEGKVETFNRVFARMWGVPDAVQLTQDSERIVQCMLDQVSEPQQYLGQVSYLSVHPEEESMDQLKCKDGRVIERYSRPQLSNGKGMGRVWSFRDITERRSAEVALQNSEEKFHALYAQSSLAIVITTLPEGRVSDANTAAEVLLGRRLADVRGLTTTEMNVWIDLEERNQYAQLLARDRTVDNFEARMRRADGTEIAVLSSGRAVHFGGQTYLLNSLLDISARKRTELELQQNREQFIDLFDNAPVGYHEVDHEGRVTRINKTELKMLGFSADELLGQFVWKITADEAITHEAVSGKLHGAKNEAQVFEMKLRRKDGSLFPVLVEDRILRSEDGTITGIRSVVQDITIHKQAEERAQHLANFPELNPNPVLEFTADGALGYHNPAALSMAQKVGFPNLKDLLPLRTKQIVAECLAAGQPQLRLETQHGPNTLSWSFYPINAQQIVHCYIGDITKRLQLEEQFRQAQKMEAIGQLSGGVAHDFNNLLTVILGNIGLLQSSGVLTPEVTEPLQAIGHAANRAANLTRQLLAFSRQQVMQQQNLDLNAVVGHISKMLRRVIGETVKIRLDYALQSLPIYADPGMLEQVILNLCINARDAMPQGGQLTLRTTTVDISVEEARLMVTARAGSFALMIVSDTGTGIAPENMKRVFEPFFTTKEVGKGTGLGLASVYGIAQQHNGWVTVESELGRGTTFAVYLPLLNTPPAVRSQPTDAGKFPRGTETILLVEDDPAVQMVAKVTLTRLGYQVLAAGNGHQALRIWQERKADIDLVLTDMIMPEGLSGKDIAQRFKSELPGIRIIFMSGYSADIAGTDFAPAEGDYFIGKPFEMHALATVIRKSLDTVRTVPTVGA